MPAAWLVTTACVAPEDISVISSEKTKLQGGRGEVVAGVTVIVA